MISYLKSIIHKITNTSTSNTYEIPIDNIPRHVAIITDGNGRWAKGKGMARTYGHSVGMKRVREIIEASDDLGIGYLTYYSFSTENWKRPIDEVEFLMKLPIDFLKSDLKLLMRRNVKVNILGDIEELPLETKRALQKFEITTKNNTGLVLNIAMNYGSRQEIVRGIKSLLGEVIAGRVSQECITEELISNSLSTKGIPDPDLLIRTSGELRVSNFLLWQIAYSELWFTDVLWPDFDKNVFMTAIRDYNKRSRRYGALE